ncbi:MAG: 16S rRNA (cytidine(1402)-2'-O)-methyltransferase [Candidatus Omnitrophica bacterium]|nr:16S rRNA (cytidine(1402)-2'-O)-methyltransferase [Candidatus Omnitrophota bacterium]
MKPSSSGTLFVVSTPIGNLKDISHRALEVLGAVDMILAEDTRQTSKLLFHFNLKTPRISFHDFSSDKKLDSLICQLEAGKNMALVSDSGTPLLSDPGFNLVREAIAKNIPIVPVPGASALLASIVASGVPMDRFVFEGFLPQKGSSRKERLENIAKAEATQILYESPYHVTKLLESLKEIFGGGRPLVIGRELTKIHEEFLRGTVDELIAHFSKVTPRGEFVVIIPKEAKKS